MKTHTKCIPWMLAVFAVLLLFPTRVSANGPTPAWRIDCELSGAPANAALVELLIQIQPGDEAYTPFNATQAAENRLTETSEIAAYDAQGFRSYTLHYRGARSTLVPDQSGQTHYAEGHFNELIQHHHVVKIAVLDAQGAVLAVSDAMDLAPKGPGFFTGRIVYNAVTGEADYSIYTSPLTFLFLAVAAAFRMLLSASVETLVAIPFRLRDKYRVFLMNIVTQLALILFMAWCPLPYFAALALGECGVLAVEALILRGLYRELPFRRTMLFAVLANAASLLIGLALNLFARSSV